jgi:hypothetical protein
VEIKQAAEMEWAEKEGFLGRKKIVEKNLGCCSLNKKIKTFELKTEEIRIKPSFDFFFKNRQFKIWLKRFKIGR